MSVREAIERAETRFSLFMSILASVLLSIILSSIITIVFNIFANYVFKILNLSTSIRVFSSIILLIVLITLMFTSRVLYRFFQLCENVTARVLKYSRRIRQRYLTGSSEIGPLTTVILTRCNCDNVRICKIIEPAYPRYYYLHKIFASQIIFGLWPGDGNLANLRYLQLPYSSKGTSNDNRFIKHSLTNIAKILALFLIDQAIRPRILWNENGLEKLLKRDREDPCFPILALNNLEICIYLEQEEYYELKDVEQTINIVHKPIILYLRNRSAKDILAELGILITVRQLDFMSNILYRAWIEGKGGGYIRFKEEEEYERRCYKALIDILNFEGLLVDLYLHISFTYYEHPYKFIANTLTLEDIVKGFLAAGIDAVIEYIRGIDLIETLSEKGIEILEPFLVTTLCKLCGEDPSFERKAGDMIDIIAQCLSRAIWTTIDFYSIKS